MREYMDAAASPTAAAPQIRSASLSGWLATCRASAQLQPINPRLLKIMGHNITVASSPRAAGPKRRAVTTPVITPQPWMARLVKNVLVFALEKIMGNCAASNLGI